MYECQSISASGIFTTDDSSLLLTRHPASGALPRPRPVNVRHNQTKYKPIKYSTNAKQLSVLVPLSKSSQELTALPPELHVIDKGLNYSNVKSDNRKINSFNRTVLINRTNN